MYLILQNAPFVGDGALCPITCSMPMTSNIMHCNRFCINPFLTLQEYYIVMEFFHVNYYINTKLCCFEQICKVLLIIVEFVL